MKNANQKRVEREFRLFVTKHFETPSKCKDIKQVQFYIHELSVYIESLKKNFNYVPDYAYSLLADYNKELNKSVFQNFKALYSQV